MLSNEKQKQRWEYKTPPQTAEKPLIINSDNRRRLLINNSGHSTTNELFF